MSDGFDRLMAGVQELHERAQESDALNDLSEPERTRVDRLLDMPGNTYADPQDLPTLGDLVAVLGKPWTIEGALRNPGAVADEVTSRLGSADADAFVSSYVHRVGGR